MRRALLLALLVAGAWPLASATPAQDPPAPRAGPPLSTPADLPARRLAVVAVRHYTMHGAVRPLYLFWIRRNDVGSAEIWWRRGQDGAIGYELVAGSDPLRAPRKINRWGYISEEMSDGRVSQLGIMRASEEKTYEEAERGVERDKKGEATFAYKAIRTDVAQGKGRTGVFWLHVERDLTLRELDDLLALIPAGQKVEREFDLPRGVRAGYLGTLAEIMKASVRWHTSKGGSPRIEGQRFPYIYYGKAYDLMLKSSKFVARASYKDRAFTNAIEGQFRVVNLKTGEKTDFRVDYGTEGELAEVPVHGVFQPRWWLEVEVVLDEAQR